MTKFYVKNDGKTYLGGFDGVQPPVGSIEVPTAPRDARFEWNGSAWVEPVILKDELVEEKRDSQVLKEVSTLEMINALWRKANGDDVEFDRINAIKQKAEQDFPK